MTLHRSLLGGIALLALTGCASATADVPPTPASPTAEPTPAAAPFVGSWAPDAPPTDLGDGRAVAHCDGDAPFLCVTDGDTLLGTLEHMSYDAPPELAGRTDRDLDDALRAFAADQVAGTALDRAEFCGSDHTVTGADPATVEVGGQQGLRWDVTTTRGDVVVEQVVLWATVTGDRLDLVVATAALADGCMASELAMFPPAVLEQLVPVFDRFVAGTPLPV